MSSEPVETDGMVSGRWWPWKLEIEIERERGTNIQHR